MSFPAIVTENHRLKGGGFLPVQRRLKGDINSMNAHTVARHVKLPPRANSSKTSRPSRLYHNRQTLVTDLRFIGSVTLSFSWGASGSSTLKASPKGEGFSPIPRRRH